jgi:NADPH-dependent ferric siderophore reductase
MSRWTSSLFPTTVSNFASSVHEQLAQSRLVTVIITGRTPIHRTRVLRTVALTPRMRRITLTGESLVGLSTRPAQDVELILTEESGRRIKRRYTIRAARPLAGEIDVDALLHGHGPGSSWASTAARGDDVSFLGPRGKLELRPADWHLFVGDESALPAFASFIEALPVHERALAVVEVGDGTDELPIGTAVEWVHRDGAPPGLPDLLAAALERLDPPTGNGRAYLLGESRAVVALRSVVNGLGLPDDQVFVKGYWNLGRGVRAVPGSDT